VMYAECHVCCTIYKPFMLSAFMLSVVMLSAVMLIVMAPCQHRLSDHENDIILNLFQN
jgi:hypothetical protein